VAKARPNVSFRRKRKLQTPSVGREGPISAINSELSVTPAALLFAVPLQILRYLLVGETAAA
jgi:hypothetical protein